MKSEFLKYGCTTIINTGVNIGVFFLLRDAAITVEIANLISVVIEIPISFLMKYKYVFPIDKYSSVRRVFLKFVETRCLSILLELILVPALSIFISDKVSKIITQLLLFLWNYFASKFFVFKDRK